MRWLATMELQRLAVLLLGIGYIVNATAECLISLVRDGATNPVVIDSLAENQHYIVIGLGTLATFHIVAGAVNFARTSTPNATVPTAESTAG